MRVEKSQHGAGRAYSQEKSQHKAGGAYDLIPALRKHSPLFVRCC